MRCTQPDRRTVSPTLDLVSSAQVWLRNACMSSSPARRALVLVRADTPWPGAKVKGCADADNRATPQNHLQTWEFAQKCRSPSRKPGREPGSKAGFTSTSERAGGRTRMG